MLVVCQEFAKGEVLFVVPLHLALTDSEDVGSPDIQGASWYIRLAAQLLRERNSTASAWQPYIQVGQPYLRQPISSQILTEVNVGNVNVLPGKSLGTLTDLTELLLMFMIASAAMGLTSMLQA